GVQPVATACVNTRAQLSPLAVAPHVTAFADAATQDVTARYADRLGPVTPVEPTAQAVLDWAREHALDQIVTPDTPVGPNATLVGDLMRMDSDIPVRRIRRSYDDTAWPHATHGFFRFKDKIPSLLGQLRGLRAAE
ncbi:MAG: DNA photolyase, partial [Pseudomonadota bacterium]